MRFLIGFVSGIVAMAALRHGSLTPRRRLRTFVRTTLARPSLAEGKLARYYRVSLN